MTQRAKRRALRRKREQQKRSLPDTSKGSPQEAVQEGFRLWGLTRTLGLEELRRSVRAIQDFRLNPRVCAEALDRAARALSSAPIPRPNQYDPSHRDFIIASQEERSSAPVQLWEIRNGVEATIESSISSAAWRFSVHISRITISIPMNDITTIECTMIVSPRLWTVEGNRLRRRDRQDCEIYGTVIAEHRFFDSDTFEIDFRAIPQRMNGNFDAMHFEVAPNPDYSDYFAVGRARLEHFREVQFPVNSSMIPASDRRPKACQGCSYYHEPAYRGDTLTCAVHPEGVQSESCPDWMSGGVERSL
jgi:hypothetical protein